MRPSTIRVGTWNILGRQRHQRSGNADGAVKHILTNEAVDVLCLQEVHFYNGTADPKLLDELRLAGLKYFVGAPLSPSHLDARAQLGLGIAARFPLRHTWLHRLDNPLLRARVRGKDWVLHDKGLVGAVLDVGTDHPVEIYSLHLFPFFEFGVHAGIHVDRMWTEFWKYADRVGDSTRVILAGDYNQADRAGAARRCSSRQWSFCVPTDKETTTIGMSLDDVAINWPATCEGWKVVPTFSDHHLVIVELRLLSNQPPADPRSRRDATPQHGDATGKHGDARRKHAAWLAVAGRLADGTQASSDSRPSAS